MGFLMPSILLTMDAIPTPRTTMWLGSEVFFQEMADDKIIEFEMVPQVL